MGFKQGRRTPLAPFRSRDFRLLWFGSFVSQAGSQMHVVAVSWQVYQLTQDPLALGAIGIARLVPLLLLALGSGVLADAIDRRKLMIWSQTAMMLCSASLALASSLGFVTIWWIYAVTALSSAAGTLGQPARQVIFFCWKDGGWPKFYVYRRTLSRPAGCPTRPGETVALTEQNVYGTFVIDYSNRLRRSFGR